VTFSSFLVVRKLPKSSTILHPSRQAIQMESWINRQSSENGQAEQRGEASLSLSSALSALVQVVFCTSTLPSMRSSLPQTLFPSGQGRPDEKNRFYNEARLSFRNQKKRHPL
jgi:hypothetical protein